MKIFTTVQGEEKNLHVLWMVAYAFNELCWFDYASADFVNGRKEWESARN